MDGLGVAEMPRDFIGVERRGHDKDAKIWPKRAPHFKRERKRCVAGERTLVEFVEDHEADI
jgi:hypothetical protein